MARKTAGQTERNGLELTGCIQMWETASAQIHTNRWVGEAGNLCGTCGGGLRVRRKAWPRPTEELGVQIGGAAGRLDRFEFHELRAGEVGVIEVELPFAIATDFGRLRRLDAVVSDLFETGLNVGHS